MGHRVRTTNSVIHLVRPSCPQHRIGRGMSVTIRRVSEEDFSAWMSMRDALYSGLDPVFHQKEMQLYSKSPDKQSYVAVLEEESTPIGFIEVSLRNIVDGCESSPVGYVEGFYILPDYRGLGVARKLFTQAEKWFVEQGCTEVGTDAELENSEAQRFHEHLGFQETYRIVEYKKKLKQS